MIAVTAGKIQLPSPSAQMDSPTNGVSPHSDRDLPTSDAPTNERTNGDGADAKQQQQESSADQWEMGGGESWAGSKKSPPTNIGKGGLLSNRTMPRFCPHSPARGTSPSLGGVLPTPTPPGQHVVHLHVNPGEAISLQMGDHLQVIQGPATVRMVSNSSSPPIPVPVQVPPGHMVQQIVDENGTLRHVIFSPQPPPMAVPMPPNYGGGQAPATASGTTPFYTFPHPGYPPPPAPPPPPHPHHPHPSHFHPRHPPPHLQATMSHQMHQHPHQGPSPPLLHPLHKDDRTNKQFVKLKRKLEARQRATNHTNNSPTSTHTYQPVSPKKDITSRKSKDRKLCTSGLEDTDENHNQEDEEETRILLELLSKLARPQVSEVGARSACVRWKPPEMQTENGSNKYGGLDIQESEFVYDLTLMSDRGGEGKTQDIYSGGDLEFTLTNLKPAKEYHVCLRVSLDDLRGNPTEVLTFKTQACKPETPSPPKLLNRSKSSLNLRWNPVTENGARLSAYVLEWDEGNGSANFVEAYSGLQKQYRLNKLTTATVYRFRLYVKSDRGPSDCSEVVGFATNGSIPTQPLPPVLKEAMVTKLGFTWELRPHDDSYILQMDDEATPYGFLPIYNGPDCDYVCSLLRRNTEYRFRLAASNEEGTSRWSDTVVARTLPDRPLPPGKPYLKGKNQSTWFKIAWDPPKDDGGTSVTRYRLESASDGGEYRVLYEGTDHESRSDNLQPGETYRYKVAALGPGGWSEYSDVGSVTALPVCPGPCSLPTLDGKAKAISLNLRWAHPEYSGGAPVTEFEIELTNPDESSRIAYRGRDTGCMVAGLSPGKPYGFRVRAFNKAGVGTWSEKLEALSGAGPPERPVAPVVTCRSSNSAQISWEEPLTNGADITEYRLEYSQAEGPFSQIFAGENLGFEMRTLAPARRYDFRIQAVNSEGGSEFSDATSCVTPPSIPGPVSSSMIQTTASPTSIHLCWQEPTNNGSEIVAYNLDFGDKLQAVTVQGSCSFTVQELAPETVYRIKVQAVNGIGCGLFSNPVKATTKALPPPPPRLECMFASYNCIKLKWGDGKSLDFNTYRLEMETRHGSYTPVYQGLLHNHKVIKLAETTSYRFRILAINEAGEGPPSEVHVFSTTKAPPPAIKGVKVSSVTETSCLVEWPAVKPMGDDLLFYQVQLLNGRQQEGRLVYKGTDTRYCLQNLEPRTEYQVRVCAVRQPKDSSVHLAGAYSTGGGHFTTHCKDPPVAPLDKSSVASTAETVSTDSPKLEAAALSAGNLVKLESDEVWAIVILCGFTFLAVLIAVIIQQIIAYTKGES